MPRKGTKLSPEAAARQAAGIARWKKENIETINVQVHKGERQKYHDLARSRGTTLSRMILDYLDGELEKEEQK